MQKSFLSYLCLIVVFVFSSCAGQATEGESKQPPSKPVLPTIMNPFPYLLTNPDTIYTLPARLYEVSGLSFRQEGELSMIEDERGILYIYDFNKGEITYKKRFAKDDDYEGIEIVGDKLYALKSDGDVFEVQDYYSENIKTRKFETAMREANDTEGLGYDPVNQQLLITCKALPYLKKKQYKGSKAIYAFDLAGDSLITVPVILIEKDKIVAYFESQLPADQKGSVKKVTFNPSAIAVHPILDEIYVLASTGKLLISINRKGEIRNAFHLDSQLFKHPEGICFSPDGTLFISNEGDAGRPNLLQFSFKN